MCIKDVPKHKRIQIIESAGNELLEVAPRYILPYEVVLRCLKKMEQALHGIAILEISMNNFEDFVPSKFRTITKIVNVCRLSYEQLHAMKQIHLCMQSKGADAKCLSNFLTMTAEIDTEKFFSLLPHTRLSISEIEVVETMLQSQANNGIVNKLDTTIITGRSIRSLKPNEMLNDEV